MTRSFYAASSASFVLRSAVALATTGVVMLAASSAHAQEPRQQDEEAVRLQNVQAPAGQPVSTAASENGIIECSLGDHAGVPDADASTAREYVAHELAQRHAPPGSYEVRLGKLGSRTLIAIGQKHADRTINERQTLVSGMEELPIAAPRLIDALVSGRPLEETQTANNVLANEAHAPTLKQGRLGFEGGVIGATPISVASGVGAGAEAGLLYESDRFGLLANMRLSGGSSGGQNNFTYFTLGVGARYFITESDITPFVGGGAGFSAYNVDTNDNSGMTGTGFSLYAEGGVEAFRTHRTSMFAALRLDAPLFTVASNGSSTYAMPVSLTLGMFLH